MGVRFVVIAGFLGLSLWAANHAVNQGVELYPYEIEHPESTLPPDGDEKTEWAFARIRYPTYTGAGLRPRGGYQYYSWGIDAPKAERQFTQGVRRLTRIHARSVEEVVNLDTDGIFNWPWIYAVEVGHWDLSDAQCAKLREHLLRGGFLMVDDFHGTREWEIFMRSMRRVFPDRPVVDIEPKDQIFHIVYDLENKFQVPGAQFLYSGQLWEHDGVEPKWRGVYDDRGRLMVGILHNQDHGDAWEWADRPEYPEKYASQAYRIGVNYLIYSMTH